MEIKINIYELIRTVHQHGIDYGMKIQKQFDDQRNVIKDLNLKIAEIGKEYCNVPGPCPYKGTAKKGIDRY